MNMLVYIFIDLPYRWLLIPITVEASTKKSVTVYVTRTGKKYHRKKCGNGTYYKSTLAKAENAGLTPGKICY